MNIRDIIRKSTKILQEAGVIASPFLDAQLLLAYALGTDKKEIIMHPRREITSEDIGVFEGLLARRVAHEPIAYIIGRCEFFGMNLEVSSNVLIPRADTETLVELSLDSLIRGEKTSESAQFQAQSLSPRILEIGTGSGAISIAIAKNLRTEPQITAIDISRDALEIARDNAGIHNVEINFIHADFFAIENENTPFSNQKFDAIISNPPYISAEDCRGLMPSVRLYEPQIALCGGADGLDFYRAIAEFANMHLNENGFCAIEIGMNQAPQITEIFAENALILAESRRDIAGITRALKFIKQP